MEGALEMTSTSTDTGEGELPRRLRRQIELHGLSRVSADLGVSRESLARYLGRVDVRAGTLALIESRIAALDDAVERPPGCLCQWEQGDSPCPAHPSPDEMEAADALSR